MLEKILVKEIVAPIIIILISIIAYAIAKAVIRKIFKLKTFNNKNVDSKRLQTIVSLCINFAKFFIIIVAVITILDVYGIDTKSLLASLGVFSAVLALALQDILKDFVAGISIIIEGQFRLGDVVTIGGFKGEVVNLSLKSTRLKAYTGEIKILANRNVTEVINHSLSKSLAVVDVGVAYESDLDKVEKVLKELSEKLSNEIDDLVEPIEILGVNAFDASSVVYRVTAITKPTTNFGVERQIRKAIKLAFDENNITIPFNQLVIHNG